MKRLPVTFGLLAVVFTTHAEPVGIAGRKTDVFLPGPELVTKLLQTAKDPLDLRILAVYPHGSAGFRYDLEFIGYEPGTLNLAAWLEPKDGAAPVALPAVEVEITSSLPPGKPGALEEPTFPSEGVGGGYFTVLLLVLLAWLAGGIALAAAWIKSHHKPAAEVSPLLPTPAEQLRPLILQALQGELDPAGKADLERKVIGFWRDRLKLSGLAPGEALQKIRDDAEAGRLLRLIEDWLHNPEARISTAEVNHALEPYASA